MLRQILRLFSLILICVLVGVQGSLYALAATTEITPIDPIQQVDMMFQKAFTATNAGDFAKAEVDWTEIIERYPDNAAAWSNRGNVRVSQNKLESAIADYNEAIHLAPDVPDPYLNRGAALEGLGKWDAAIVDYNHVLELNPDDAMAYNNRGNAKAGQGKWEAALVDYHKATEIAPNFAFAYANYALSLYEIGRIKEAIRSMRNTVRKYPQFPDVRAALTAALWVQGDQGEAESQWVSVVGLDRRYKDLNWVTQIRRWPPAIAAALGKFLSLQSGTSGSNNA
jgi:tetratricopeptide (TPR) repeat protein